MYVVGCNPDRRHFRNDMGDGSAPAPIGRPFLPSSHGHLEIFKHLNLRGWASSYPPLGSQGDGDEG
jgi:hypothetical protein